MLLSELKTNEVAIIKKVMATGDVKSRLNSLGIVKNEKVKMLRFTLAKQTYEIEIGVVKVALRKEEAEQVEVAK